MFHPTQNNGGKPAKHFHFRPAKTLWGNVKNIVGFLNDKVYAVNNSKIFAGLIIILLNVSSKFVTIKLSKTMESYFKNTFSRDALIFAMAWMGTRDIYVALFMTCLFIVAMNYVLNEESQFCVLPESFTDYHLSISENILSTQPVITNDEVKKAKDVLEQAKKQGLSVDDA